MSEKSILEQALLSVQTLEEAVKQNAKGILASTMKQELNELLKESEEKEERASQEDEEALPNEESIEDMSEQGDEDDVEGFADKLGVDYLMPHYYNGRITFMQYHKEK